LARSDRRRAARAHDQAPGPATPTLEATVLGLVTVQTPEGLMVDPMNLERLLKAVFPILRALPPDGDVTGQQRHWLTQVAVIADAIGALDLAFTVQLQGATFTPVEGEPAS
jgi:hypothetical protein